MVVSGFGFELVGCVYCADCAGVLLLGFVWCAVCVVLCISIDLMLCLFVVGFDG